MKRKEVPSSPLSSNGTKEVEEGAAKGPEAPAVASVRSPTLGKFYCGCAGFANGNWVGNFYPNRVVGHNSERQLNHYQRHFNSVEINGTFYGMPTDETIAKWKGQASTQFQFVLKGKKTITHEGQTELNISELEIFLQRAMLLSEHVVVLIQCPQSLVVTTGQLQNVRDIVSSVEYKGRLAFEFRNGQTYKNQAIRTFLRQNNWALVYHPNSVGRYTTGTSVSGRGDNRLGTVARMEYSLQDLSNMALSLRPTADFVYIRLHGTNDEHRYDYTPAQLDQIARQIHKWRQEELEVFCFLLNDLEPQGSKVTGATLSCETWSAMPKNARQLMERVHGLANEEIPRAPKQPRNTIASFFSPKKRKAS